jgi:hypothetical protein
MCIKNEECDDLEIRKVYEILPDKKAEKDGYVRVSDKHNPRFCIRSNLNAPPDT